MSLATRIIPILLHRGYGLYKGTKFNSWRQVGHVMQAMRTHQARGVDEMILLDIAATKDGRGPDIEILSQISEECFSPLTVGGGITCIDDIRQVLSAGADKVSICNAAACNPNLIYEAAREFGSQAIVVAIDYNAAHAVADIDTFIHPSEYARQIEDLGAGEILLTDMERDGMMCGYDLDMIHAVAHAVQIPVIANGGCRDYEDMYQAILAGASAVAAGALFAFTDSTPRGAAEYLAAKGVETRL